MKYIKVISEVFNYDNFCYQTQEKRKKEKKKGVKALKNESDLKITRRSDDRFYSIFERV